MVTQLAVAVFVGLLVVLWMRGYQRFPGLARQYLCIAPFLPLVSLLNHNVDHERWGTTTRVLPMYVALLLLLLSLLLWRARGANLRFGVEELFILLYIGFCAAQIPGSVDWSWALCAWSWSAPGYLIFLIAGRAAAREEVYGDRLPVWTLLGVAAISVGLIVVSLVTGQATQLFYTRNFGSIYASTAMLLFLTLWFGLCWLVVRSSVTWSFVALVVSSVCMILSLSRTALLTLLVYLLVMVTGARGRVQRTALAIALVLVTLAVSFFFAAKRFDLDAELLQSWSARFHGGDYGGAYSAARQLRDANFSHFHEQIWRDVPWHGQGYGTFRHFSEYSDAHDLLVTEAFENSLLAAIFLVMAYSLPKVVKALFFADLRPIAISILGFMVLGQVTGGMLAWRSEDHYYTAYPGWTLFYLVGFLSAQLRLRSDRHGALAAEARFAPDLGATRAVATVE